MRRTLLHGVTALALLATTAAGAAAQSTVELPRRDTRLTGDPTPVFRVGTVEGREWEMFSGVRAVAFDRNDNLYVLDGQNLRVVVFDRSGRYVRHFGKKGGGPGEFQAPLSLTVLANDELVVSDLANRSYLIFSPAGEYVRSVPFSAAGGMPIGGIQAHPLGIVSRGTSLPGPGGPAPERNVSPLFVQPLVTGADPITIYEMPLAPPQVMDSDRGGAPARMMIRRDPVFAPRPVFGAMPDGTIALQHETEYRVHLFDRNGRPLRTITRDIEPRKVTTEHQEKWRERQERGDGGAVTAIAVTTGGGGGSPSVSFGGARGGGAPPVPGRIDLDLDSTPFAERMSVINDILTDPMGRLWVQRRAEDGSGTGPIDLITTSGRYIGTLSLADLPDAVSASGLAAWIERDDMGVERVAVRRLPASWK